MVDTLIRHIMMVLIIWQVVCCYQYWVLAQVSLARLGRRHARQRRRQRTKDFQRLDHQTDVCAG